VRSNNEFDFELLADWSKNFSGAEIEQIIYEAMQQGFSRGEEFIQANLLDAIAVCIPLVRLAQPQIEKLKHSKHGQPGLLLNQLCSKSLFFQTNKCCRSWRLIISVVLFIPMLSLSGFDVLRFRLC
jgi:SpoVK/Ycf46/Vps4 family AAA+-type ATPase